MKGAAVTPFADQGHKMLRKRFQCCEFSLLHTEYIFCVPQYACM